MVQEREYWNPVMETMEVEKLREVQWRKFKRVLTYAYNYSPLYHELYTKAGIEPGDIKSLEDVTKIPIVRKDMFREIMEKEQDPFAHNLTIPLEEVEEVYQSAGTTGLPTFTALTRGEYQALSEFFARWAWTIGLRPGDLVIGPTIATHPVFTYGAAGTQRVGAKWFPDLPHPILTPRWFDHLRYTKAEVFAPASDMLSTLEEETIKRKLNFEDIFGHLKQFHIYGEALTPYLRKRGKDRLRLKCDITNTHALSELFFVDDDCRMLAGNHVWMDAYLLETVDPETDELLKPGEMGELVFTNLIMESTPVIRFGTEDMGIVNEEKCDCGRTHPRITLYGRSTWLLRIKGVKFTTFQLQELFERFPETDDAFFTALKEKGEMEKLRLKATYKEAITKDPEQLRERLQAEIKKELGIDSEIEWVGMDAIPFRFHKIVRVTEV